MKNKFFMLRLGAAAGALAIVPLAGCGGSSVGGDNSGLTTQAADPYIYAVGDNITADEVSAFGTNAAGTEPGNPSTSDVLYFTFASANSAPTLTESGAHPFATGPVQAAATYAEGTEVPAIPAGSGSVFFRAQGAQGQLANRSVPDITAATLSVNNGAATSLTFPAYDQNTAAGPFASSPYYLATPSFSSITTSGVVSATASITDSADRTTSTTFQGVVLAPTDAAIASTGGYDAVNEIQYVRTITLTGGTATTVYGPDASGTQVDIVPPGTYDITVATSATSEGTTTTSTYTQTGVTVTAGNVYIAESAAPKASTSQIRHR